MNCNWRVKIIIATLFLLQHYTSFLLYLLIANKRLCVFCGTLKENVSSFIIWAIWEIQLETSFILAAQTNLQKVGQIKKEKHTVNVYKFMD